MRRARAMQAARLRGARSDVSAARLVDTTSRGYPNPMLIPPAYAQAAGGAAGGGGLESILSIAPLFLVFIAFYFLMLRPQQRRVKALQAAVEAVKKGDTVTTAGGIVGKVTRVEERFVEVEIAPTVKVRVIKATLTGIGGAEAAND